MKKLRLSKSLLIFSGHFTIGEKINLSQRKGIEEAKKIKGDFAILVNDIDLKRKILFFEAGGRDLVMNHYRTRRKCGAQSEFCKIVDLNELEESIDWNFYERALEEIQKSRLSLDEVLRQKIIPEAIFERICLYGFQQISVKVFTERELRNRASLRLANSRRNGRKSWVPLLGGVESLQSMGNTTPICRAIMLALYEKISEMGYDKIIQLYEEKDRRAIEGGAMLCERLHENFPEDIRWSMEIKNEYF